MSPYLWRKLAMYRHLAAYNEGISSNLTGRNLTRYVIVPGTTETWHFNGCNWDEQDGSFYGQGFMPNGFANARRIFITNIRIRIQITNFHETGRVRICVARPKNDPASDNIDNSWNSHIDFPLDRKMYNIYYVKYHNTHNPDDSTQVFTTTLNIPVNRVFNTNDRLVATHPEDWYDSSTLGRYTRIYIDSDDANSTDNEVFKYKLFVEQHYYEFE
jgi:hypothetical protein